MLYSSTERCQRVLPRGQIGVQPGQALLDQAQRGDRVAQVDLDQGQAVVVEDRVERLFLRFGQQRGDADGLVDPGLGLGVIATVGVMMAGIQHGGRVGSLHVDLGAGGEGACFVVEGLGFFRAAQGSQRRGHLGGERPPHALLPGPVDDHAAAAAQVDRGVVKAHVNAVIEREPQRPGSGAGRVGAALTVERDRPQPQRQLLAGLQPVSPRIVQHRALLRAEPLIGCLQRRLVTCAVALDVLGAKRGIIALRRPRRPIGVGGASLGVAPQ